MECHVNTDDRSRMVELAAEHLDINLPGWYNRIDISYLDLESTYYCILGQLFWDKVDRWGFDISGYRQGHTELGMAFSDKPLPGVSGDVFASDQYRDRWVNAINVRRVREQAASVQSETSPYSGA